MKQFKYSFNRFSLDQKILTLILIEVFGFCLATLITFYQIRSVGNEVQQMVHISIPLFELMEKTGSQIESQHLATKTILLTYNLSLHPNKITQEYLAARQNYMKGEHFLQHNIDATKLFIDKLSFHTQIDKDSIVSLYSEGLLKALFKLKQATQSHHRLLLLLFKQMEQDTTTIDANFVALITSSDALVKAKLDALNTQREIITFASAKRATHIERIAISFVTLTSIFGIIFFIAVVLLIVRKNILKPLQLLTDTINTFTALHKVEESEFEKDIIERHDELGRMGRSFNRLKHDLWRQGKDLESAKNEAEKANRAKSMFLASASHDLRQPLNAMQMYIAALKLKINSKNLEALDIIDNIETVSVSTAQLLNALLDVSQLESGAIKPHFQYFPVQDVLHQVFRSFLPVANEKKLTLKIMPSTTYIRSDPVLLERILGNFTSNALRYTKTGRVVVGCRRKGNNLSIEVWDSGCGIPNSQIKPIFEDFHQLDNKERDKGKGLGLGLAIAKRLSICLGHEIECNSIVGKGSKFSVLTPISKQSHAQLLKNKPAPNVIESLVKGLSGTCVLLIEDNFDVLKATQQLLESWECIVYSGRNLIEVERVIEAFGKEAPPDIIIADNRLPCEANGMEVATHIQKILAKTIPTVIVTGDVEENHIKEIADQGFPVLYKPVQPAKLRAIISHLTSK